VALITALFLAWPSSSMRAPAVSQDEAIRKISPFLASVREGEAVEFLVVLGEQAALGDAYSLSDRVERGYFTRNSLYYLAESTQTSLRTWLNENQIEYRSYYIVNAIWVRATLDVVRAISLRPDVARIEANPIINNFQRPELMRVLDGTTPNQEAVGQNALAVPEPGVSYIRAPEVWAAGFTGQGIIVGGADTGIKWDHAALKNHYRGWNGSTASPRFQLARQHSFRGRKLWGEHDGPVR
jgi:subtilisin family serine protease